MGMINVILKKPYAFLIKKFRLIHLLLTFLIAYILTKSIKLYSFFNRYVSNVYATLSDAIPSNYITLFMFLVVIIIVSLALAIYLLMKKKDKPRLLYILLSTYYVVFLGMLIVYFVLFKGVESNSISIRDAMIWRDITVIITAPQAVFLILSLVRAVGFDIKKFNFSKDLKELELTEEDNEEFEFVLGVDSYKYMRFFRRRLREFKYYVLENKFMFSILTGLTTIILVIMVVLNFTVYNRTYNKNQKIVANNLAIQVNNSYITNLDYSGNPIENDKYFLIVNATFTNNSGTTTVLNMTSYELKTKTGTIYPTISRNNYFVDLGAGYAKEKIEAGSSSTYILVYELSKKQVDNKYMLNIVDEIEYKAGTINSKIKKVALKPKIYSEIDMVGTYKLGTPVTMYDSILNNSSLLINSYDFMNKFTYEYEACIRGNCQNKVDVVSADAQKDKTLLVLNGSLIIDNNSTFAKNLKTSLSFFDAFVQIRYDDKVSTVVDVTPKSLVDQYIIQVDSSAGKADVIELFITVRNKKYVVKLK